MADLFNATAFGLGMLLLLNPCSFALLPSYLGLFLNINTNQAADNAEKKPLLASLNQAQIVSLTMAAGVLTVFLPIGLAFQSLSAQLGSFIPWFNVVLGVLLFGLGIAMLFGFQLVLKLPKFQSSKQASAKTLAGIYLYGISFATAALACSSPLVILALTTPTGENFTSKLGAVFSFGIGITIALITLTLAIATGSQKIVGAFRTIMSKMNVITGAILVVAGLYLAWYGLWSYAVEINPPDPFIPKGPVAWQIYFEDTLKNWLEAEISIFGSTQRVVLLGLIFLLLNLTVFVMGFFSKRFNPTATPEIG